jgi:hypothetical protein
MRIISGAIDEKRFQIQPSSTAATTTRSTLICTAHRTYTSGQIAFMHDVMGYHQIGCVVHPPSSNNGYSDSAPSMHVSVPAISLHLYTPPIRKCHIVSSSLIDDDNTTVDIVDSGPMYHYSEYGQRC